MSLFSEPLVRMAMLSLSLLDQSDVNKHVRRGIYLDIVRTVPVLADPSLPLRRLKGHSEDGTLRCVFDECVAGGKQLALYRRVCTEFGWAPAETISVAKELPGAKDKTIIRHFLGHGALLVTADRIFHNRQIARGGLSVYVGQKKSRQELSYRQRLVHVANF